MPATRDSKKIALSVPHEVLPSPRAQLFLSCLFLDFLRLSFETIATLGFKRQEVQHREFADILGRDAARIAPERRHGARLRAYCRGQVRNCPPLLYALRPIRDTLGTRCRRTHWPGRLQHGYMPNQVLGMSGRLFAPLFAG